MCLYALTQRRINERKPIEVRLESGTSDEMVYEARSAIPECQLHTFIPWLRTHNRDAGGDPHGTLNPFAEPLGA